MYRDKKGRFSRKRKLFVFFLCAAITATVYTVAVDREIKIDNPIPAVNAELPIKEIYEAKIRTVKEDMLKELSLGCETKGVKEPDGAILLDSNNKMSIGRYMFQIDTIIHYTKKLEGKTITRREAIEIAVDPQRAGKLAEKILFGEDNGYKNWKLCADKLGIAKEIEILKKLQ